MANLQHIHQLHKQYNGKSVLVKSLDVSLNEAFDSANIKKGFDNNALASLGKDYSNYFDLGLEADVALLFIDVSNFSTRYGALRGQEVANFFHQYYDLIIPIIYKYNGEVEKIIGDGIIAVFGPPFSKNNISQNIINAYNCAKEVIQLTYGNKFQSKVALHAGVINYFKNKSGLYSEFTMVGKPLTELFRLESIAEDGTICYFGNSLVSGLFLKTVLKNALENLDSKRKVKWSHGITDFANIKGIDYNKLVTVSLNEL